MIETLTRTAATTTRSTSFEVLAAQLPMATTRLAAAAALGVALTSRVAATLAGASSTPLLVALLVLSLLAFAVAAIEPVQGKIDQRAATMCRRAAVVQSVVGVATLILALV